MLKPHVDHFTRTSDILSYQVNSNEAGMTIYQLLRQRLRVSRGLLRKIRGEYRVRLNGQFFDFSTTILKTGDILEMNFNFDEKSEIKPEPLELDIIFEDTNLLVLNKPAGMLVHPTADERSHTLANGVLFHLQRQGNYNLFRPIHRLDKNTSGLVLIGKNQYAHNYLTDQFDRQIIHRQYLAIVHGVIDTDQGTINAPIGRVNGSIIERRIDKLNGKMAITHFQVLKRYSNATLISLILETGRTHQIRVHLSYLGHPLMGDNLYGGEVGIINRHALHSHKITCQLPLSHKPQELVAPLTEDLNKLLEVLT